MKTAQASACDKLPSETVVYLESEKKARYDDYLREKSKHLVGVIPVDI